MTYSPTLDSFRTKLHDPSVYAANATLIYVPTATVIHMGEQKGPMAEPSPFDWSEETAQTVGNPKKTDQFKGVLVSSSSSTGSSGETINFFEEWVLTLHHNQVINWFWPGFEATKQLFQLPFIFSGELIRDLNGGNGEHDYKIKTIRVYWDQGSAIKQTKLLDDLTMAKAVHVQGMLEKLPLHGSESAKLVLAKDKLPSTVEEPNVAKLSLGLVGDASVVAAKTVPIKPVSNDIFGTATPVTGSSRPSTRVNSAYVGGKSHDIFKPDATPPKPSIHPDPRRYESHFTSAGVAGETDHFHPGKKIDPSTNVSRFSLAQGPNEDALTQDLLPKKNILNTHHTGMMAESVPEPVANSTHHALGGYHNQSQISFGGGDGDQAFAVNSSITGAGAKGAGKIHQSQQQSHWSFGDSSSHGGNAANEKIRPSSRVLRPPGGGSSIIMG